MMPVAGRGNPSDDPHPLAAAILVGGASRRMGAPKAFIALAGEPLINRVLATLRQVAREIFLVGGEPTPYASLRLPHFMDRLPGGALAGIHSAILNSPYPYTLVVACDMPFLNAPLLRAMAASTAGDLFDVIVPTVADYPQGLHAIYGKSCLAPIERRLRAKQRKVIGFHPEVRVDTWDERRWREYDPQGRSFANLNTPAELAAAQSEM